MKSEAFFVALVGGEVEGVGSTPRAAARDAATSLAPVYAAQGRPVQVAVEVVALPVWAVQALVEEFHAGVAN